MYLRYSKFVHSNGLYKYGKYSVFRLTPREVWPRSPLYKQKGNEISDSTLDCRWQCNKTRKLFIVHWAFEIELVWHWFLSYSILQLRIIVPSLLSFEWNCLGGQSSDNPTKRIIVKVYKRQTIISVIHNKNFWIRYLLTIENLKSEQIIVFHSWHIQQINVLFMNKLDSVNEAE